MTALDPLPDEVCYRFRGRDGRPDFRVTGRPNAARTSWAVEVINPLTTEPALLTVCDSLSEAMAVLEATPCN